MASAEVQHLGRVDVQQDRQEGHLVVALADDAVDVRRVLAAVA